MRVLIIDDSRAMRRLERDVLAELGGVEVVEAEDGVSALYKMRDIGFQLDLILADWNMPRMDGLTFVRHVKSTPNLRRIPILMVTSCSDESKMRLAWSSGVDGYLLKPFTRELVLQAIVSLGFEFTGHVDRPAGEDTRSEQSSFLGELPPDLRVRLINMSVPRQVGAGETILEQGEVPDCFCFVDQGKVAEIAAGSPGVETPEGKEPMRRELGPGSCFGVTELMAGDPLRSRFTALVPSQVGRLPKEVFEGMLEKFPKISLILSKHLAAQARHLELAGGSGDSDLAGRLEVLDLPTLVQAINLRQKSCVIELTDIQAEIVFLCGQVIAVRCEECEGEEAFYRIIAQNPRSFRLVVKPVDVPRNVQLNTTRLLLESARYIDEKHTTAR